MIVGSFWAPNEEITEIEHRVMHTYRAVRVTQVNEIITLTMDACSTHLTVNYTLYYYNNIIPMHTL